MRTEEIIKEIQRLPLQQRMYVVEKAINSIRKQENLNQMTQAADELMADYSTDKELTEFTNIDLDDFYEAR